MLKQPDWFGMSAGGFGWRVRARRPRRSHWSPITILRASPSPAPNRASTLSGVRQRFGLEVAAIALVLSACTAGPSERPSPSEAASLSASPGPTVAVSSTPAPTASASPTPTASAPTMAYGYVELTDGRITVRRERDASIVFDITGVRGGSAVSADGKRLAYWRATPNVGATQLRVVDLADSKSDHAVYDVADDSLGGAIVWSNDASGLLYETHTVEAPTGIPGGNASGFRYPSRSI